MKTKSKEMSNLERYAKTVDYIQTNWSALTLSNNAAEILLMEEIAASLAVIADYMTERSKGNE